MSTPSFLDILIFKLLRYLSLLFFPSEPLPGLEPGTYALRRIFYG